MATIRRLGYGWRTYLEIAGLGLFLFVPRFGLADQKNSQNAQQIAAYPPDYTPPAGRPAPADTLVEPDPCKRPENAEETNLCIQWRAMEATEKQAYWAKLTFMIGCLGLPALLATLVYTAFAAKAAQVSAHAAERAVEESTKTLAHAQDVAARCFVKYIIGAHVVIDGDASPDDFLDRPLGVVGDAFGPKDINYLDDHFVGINNKVVLGCNAIHRGFPSVFWRRDASIPMPARYEPE